MIRNGMQRKLTAQAKRERLLVQWQAYPQAVQQCLLAILQDYGLQAAEFATEAVKQMSNSLSASSSEQVRGSDG